MDFFHSKRDKRYGKRAGLFGHKSVSKSNPSSPPHFADGRSPPVTSFGIKRSESDHAFEHTTHWKQQQASERVPNSHHRPPVYRYSTPERPREDGKGRAEVMSDADVTPRSNASVSPFRSPDRRRRSTDFNRELYERTYEAEANRSLEPISSLPKPAPHTRTQGYYNHGKYHFEEMYEGDTDNSPPMSSVHGATSHSPPPFYSSSDDEDDHTAYLFPEIATGHRSRGVSGSSTPVHYKYQITASETYEQDRQFEPPELPDESESFTMHEITKMRGLVTEEASKEETQLAIAEAYVSVANYKVRQSVSATLQTIMDKHGDIAASSKLQSTSTRSFYLESLATTVMELKSTSLKDLTKTRVAEIAAVVKDMDSVKVDVSWLKTAVNELAEAVEYFEQYGTAKMEKEECTKSITEGKAKMEGLREELRRREKEAKDCREKVTAMAGRLGQLEMKDARVKKHLELFESKVDKFNGEVVLVDV